MPTTSLASNVSNPSATPNGNPGSSRRAAWFGLGLLMTLAPQPLVAQGARHVDVALHVEPSLEVCPDWGEIQGLDPQGDGFLAVRTGPGTRHEQIDELHNGDVVLLCDYRNGWHGVVYPAEGQDSEECKAELGAISRTQPYRGPCKSGWIHGNWVRWIDG